MIEKIPEKYLPEHNRKALDDSLILQEGTFPDTPQYTPDRWNRRADFWETERKRQRKNDQRVEDTLKFLLERGILNRQCTVADIGCGPGRFAAAFAQHADSVTGFDISPNMVAHGNAHLQSLGLTNATLRCCDFATLDIEAEGYKGAFDLVFSSLTPVAHKADGLIRSMEMSRGWCMNISHIRRRNDLRQRILQEVFHKPLPQTGEGQAFYTLFNTLFLMGFQPETHFMTRRKETRARPDEEYVAYILEHALPVEEHTKENAALIQNWLLSHVEEDGCLTEISDAVYGCILWDVRQRIQRPDYSR